MIDVKYIRDYESLLTAMSLLKAVEDSEYTMQHSLRVGRLVNDMAGKLKFEKDITHKLVRAAYYHDVGKIKVPNHIIFKSEKLTDVEFEEMRKHPKYSHTILKSLNYLDEAEIALQHHERLDGSGYPDGLSGDKFNGLPQVLAVADVYDAMIVERPYRKAKTPIEAIMYLYSNAGKKFELFIIQILHRVLEEKKLLERIV